MRVGVSPLSSGGIYTSSLHESLQHDGVRLEALSRLRLTKNPPPILHVHWEHLLLKGGVLSQLSWLLLLALARLRGTRLVYTMHNLRPHDSPARRPWAYRCFDRQVDGLICHTAEALQQAREHRPLLSPVETAVIEPGSFVGHGPPIPQKDARSALNLGDKDLLLLAVGRIEPYKMLPELVDAYLDTRERGVRLIVAGRPSDPDEADQLLARSKAASQVMTVLKGLSDAELVRYVCASDALVCAYREILTSGVAHLALAYERPLLAPDMAVFHELQASYPDWIYTYDRDDMVNGLDGAIQWLRTRDACDPPAVPGWGEQARRTIDLYRSLDGR